MFWKQRQSENEIRSVKVELSPSKEKLFHLLQLKNEKCFLFHLGNSFLIFFLNFLVKAALLER